MGISAIILGIGMPIFNFLEELGIQGEALTILTGLIGTPLFLVVGVLLIPLTLISAISIPALNGVGLIAGLIASIFQ